MTFSFTTLGTASALPTVERYPSAHILTVRERFFLIDCGEGTQIQLKRAGISFTRIDNIFISHIHGDHIFGLPGLLSTMSLMGRTAPVFIYGPSAFKSYLDFFISYLGDGITFPVNFTPVSCKEPSMLVEFNNVEIFAFPLRHKIETYGYFFREKEPALNIRKDKIEAYNLTYYEMARLKEGRNVEREDCVLQVEELTYKPYEPRCFAYCSDTMPFAKLADWLRELSQYRKLDLLYHESTYDASDKELARKHFHSTAADAAECALKCHAGKLVLGHYSSRYRNTDKILEDARAVFPETYCAKEGDVFDIPVSRLL